MFFIKTIKKLNKKISLLETELKNLSRDYHKRISSDMYGYYISCYNKIQRTAENAALNLLFDLNNKIIKSLEPTVFGNTVKYQIIDKNDVLKVFFNTSYNSDYIVEKYTAYLNDMKFTYDFAEKLYHIIDSR